MSLNNALEMLSQTSREAASRRASEKDRNRAEFPQLASLCDQFRAAGYDARLIAGIENGKEIGKVDDALRTLGEDWN